MLVRAWRIKACDLGAIIAFRAISDVAVAQSINWLMRYFQFQDRTSIATEIPELHEKYQSEAELAGFTKARTLNAERQFNL
ncbi:hypothetical protein [Novosphingobium taihuense]|nr:hypothetical protein [Novosphingobium taihuense]TWH87101.1 hypothetical protein IQ25_01378 [Novosphingobium taihuense]